MSNDDSIFGKKGGHFDTGSTFSADTTAAQSNRRAAVTEKRDLQRSAQRERKELRQDREAERTRELAERSAERLKTGTVEAPPKLLDMQEHVMKQSGGGYDFPTVEREKRAEEKPILGGQFLPGFGSKKRESE